MLCNIRRYQCSGNGQVSRPPQETCEPQSSRASTSPSLPARSSTYSPRVSATLRPGSFLRSVSERGEHGSWSDAVRFLSSSSRGPQNRRSAEPPTGSHGDTRRRARDIREREPLSAAGKRVRVTEDAAVDGPGSSDDPHFEIESAEAGRHRDICSRAGGRKGRRGKARVDGVSAAPGSGLSDPDNNFFVPGLIGLGLSGTKWACSIKEARLHVYAWLTETDGVGTWGRLSASIRLRLMAKERVIQFNICFEYLVYLALFPRIRAE